MADLKETVALVTGAGGEIGLGIAEGLAEAGATIYLAADAASRVPQDAVEAVEALGGRTVPLTVDRSDGEALLELFRRIESESGRLDLLVNDAAQESDADEHSAAFWEHPLSIWDEHCGAGLRDCYVAAALAARLMVQQGSGLIINLSGRGRHGVQASAVCGVREAGMDRMAAEMAAELAGRGVTAISLAPGAVRTPPSEIYRSARFVGRCVAALAMDPDVAEKAGKRLEIEALRREYRFSELTEEST